MIIDEILDAKYYDYKIDLDYIQKEANLFGFKYILDAINSKDKETLKQALAKYVINNDYNYRIITNDIPKLKIKF